MPLDVRRVFPVNPIKWAIQINLFSDIRQQEAEDDLDKGEIHISLEVLLCQGLFEQGTKSECFEGHGHRAMLYRFQEVATMYID